MASRGGRKFYELSTTLSQVCIEALVYRHKPKPVLVMKCSYNHNHCTTLSAVTCSNINITKERGDINKPSFYCLIGRLLSAVTTAIQKTRAVNVSLPH